MSTLSVPTTTTKSVFIPVSFGSIGKGARDLIKKKFDYDHKLKLVTRTADGYNVEVGATAQPGSNQLRGYFKDSFSYKGYAIEGEANTDPNADTRLSVKNGKLVKGLTLEAKLNTKSDDKALAGPIYGLDSFYTRDYVNLGAEVRTNLKSHKVKSSLCVGAEGFSVGGQVVADVSGGSPQVTDYNLGLEYSGKPDYTLSLWTEKQCDFANLAYWQRVNKTTAVGSQFRVEVGGKYAHALTMAAEHALSPSTTAKAKVDIPTGIVGLAWEQRLAQPSLMVNMAATFNPRTFDKGVKADTFGFGLTMGDF